MTPPRHLAICWALKLFLITISKDPWQLGGLIEKVPRSSIASRQLVDQSSFFSLLLNCPSTDPQQLHLSTLFFSTPSMIDVSTPLSIEIYWTSIYRFCAIWFSFHSISLSIVSYFLLPNLSHSFQTSSSRFLQAFTSFSSFGKLRTSHLHAFSCFEI